MDGDGAAHTGKFRTGGEGGRGHVNGRPVPLRRCPVARGAKNSSVDRNRSRRTGQNTDRFLCVEELLRSESTAPGSEGLAPDLISIRQAAKRLGLHPDTLYRLARTGRFPPAVQIGARWVVSVPRLERYLHGQAS